MRGLDRTCVGVYYRLPRRGRVSPTCRTHGCVAPSCAPYGLSHRLATANGANLCSYVKLYKRWDLPNGSKRSKDAAGARMHVCHLTTKRRTNATRKNIQAAGSGDPNLAAAARTDTQKRSDSARGRSGAEGLLLQKSRQKEHMLQSACPGAGHTAPARVKIAERATTASFSSKKCGAAAPTASHPAVGRTPLLVAARGVACTTARRRLGAPLRGA